MQLISKTVKGHKYFYLVQKGRKNGVVTNVKTLYLGSANKLHERLTAEAVAQFPKSFESWEMGASAALYKEAMALELPGLIDSVSGPRRTDASLSYGQLLTVLAIQRAIAPRQRKSIKQAAAFYQGCGLKDLFPLPPQGLDARRVHEALEQVRASDIDRMEASIVQAMVQRYQVSLESLAFDATNFDSYAQASTGGRLLRRGHAKSRRVQLRLLGLGLLVTADDGLPLLSFAYPGNRADVTSFKSFLSRLNKRRGALKLGDDSTVVCDGGNISKEVIEQLEADRLHMVVRLPAGHAPELERLSTEQLPVLHGHFEDKVRAKKQSTMVYGKLRTMMIVHSQTMHQSQLPGLKRDIRKATKDLEALQRRLIRQRKGQSKGRDLTLEGARERVERLLERQHMRQLFAVTVRKTATGPSLSYHFDNGAWDLLDQYQLGRTLVLTDRQDWDEAKLVKCLREQSHAEESFRQLKDPEWASAVPLRHASDPMLRVHAFICVLALLLTKLMVRRLTRAGVVTTVGEALFQLSELRLARVHYGSEAPPQLKATAREQLLAPTPTELQTEIIKALGIERELLLGPTKVPLRKVKSPSRALAT